MATQTPKTSASTRFWVVLVLLLIAALFTACGSDGGTDEVDPGNAEDAPDYSKMVESAPPEFASFYDADGAGLISGGQEAYDAQIAALEGSPIVVNKWASWCGPCRIEFPHFQNEAADRGDEVAFLGLNSDDSEELASEFLSTHPVPYGSFSDPDKEIMFDLGAINFPATIFYNAAGEKTFVHEGGYTSQEDLAADVDRYAVNG
jgi:cytochrome c biogenesis protein CcmG/thiol:disulfide interchange protein DsbE